MVSSLVFMPQDEAGIEPTAELVRRLLVDQHPDLANHPLVLAARGWDNQMWRLGKNLAVRLPWRTDTADALLLKEYAWLPLLAPLLSLPVPLPRRLGQPCEYYPHPWIVTTWLPGTPADLAPARHGIPTAESLAAFPTALHRPAPSEAPEGRGRGGPPTQVAEDVAQLLAALPDLLTAVAEPTIDTDAMRAIWDAAVIAPGWNGPPIWLHGDLHPANVLTADSLLCGVIDFGDLCAGDPALDLAAASILLPDTQAVGHFRQAHLLAADEATWSRSRGWALWRALTGLAIAAAGPPGGETDVGSASDRFPAASHSTGRVAFASQDCAPPWIQVNQPGWPGQSAV